MKFSELGLHPKLQKTIQEQNFENCTPIQEVTIPPILAGKDVAGLAQTGTGKTAAFLLPLMDRILKAEEGEKGKAEEPSEGGEVIKSVPFSEWKPNHYILVLVPTRELAEQVYENVKLFGKDSGLKGVAIYGGTSYETQKSAVAKGVQFIVATPGRLIDLYKEHVVDLGQVQAIVFDEADRMFDMGFKDDMKYILRRIPRERQFLVFSATLNFDVLNVAYEFGAEPVEFNVSKDQAKAEFVDDQVFHIGSEEKPRYLLSLLKKYEPRQAIIFSNFKHNVERVAHFLTANGVPAMGISSLLSQGQRNKVMSQFKAENDRNILVATDVAARGLDIKGVDMVINYELPDDPENYVHRIGRTGRAGAQGIAFGLTSDRDVDALMRIEDYLGHKVTIGWLDESEIVQETEDFPKDVPYNRVRKIQKSRSDKAGGRRRPQGERRSKGTEEPRRRGGKDGDKRRGDYKRRENQEKRQGESASTGEETLGRKDTHRDRRLGRHRGRKQENGEPPKVSQNKRHHKDGAGTGKKKKFARTKKIKGGKKYRGGRYRVEEKPKSLGEKVSGFFKKIFTGE